MKTARIGLFGGSFDPVHNGHLALALRALEEHGLSKVLFLPTAISPFKPQGGAAALEDRVAMLRLALADEPRFELSLADANRGGTSYSYDLVVEMKRLLPEARLVFLIGADSLATLRKWHRAEELVALCDFLSFGRRGTVIDPAALGFDAETNARLAASFDRGFDMPVSSSDVRAALARGDVAAVSSALPVSVAEYIRRRGLYR